ncbi:MAG: pilin [bacterium]
MKKFLIALSAVLVPASLYAQSPSHLNNLIDEIFNLANKAVAFLMILATLYFIWVIIKLITQTDSAKRKENKEQVKWAVIGLAIMVCVWGLIRFAADTLGISTTNGNQNNIAIPCPPGTNPVGGGCR